MVKLGILRRGHRLGLGVRRSSLGFWRVLGRRRGLRGGLLLGSCRGRLLGSLGLRRIGLRAVIRVRGVIVVCEGESARAREAGILT